MIGELFEIVIIPFIEFMASPFDLMIELIRGAEE
jgi:hypothetical protein